MRTVTRVSLQFTDALKNSFWAELSAAFGRRDLALAKRLHRTAFRLSLIFGGLGVLGLAVVGPRLFRLWTHGRVGFDSTAFHLLLLVVLANGLWNASSAVPLSSNEHGRLTLVYVITSVASLGVSAFLARYWSVSGIVVGMLTVEAVMAVVVLRSSTRLVEDKPLPLFWSCFRLPTKGDLKRAFSKRSNNTSVVEPVEL
jgi:O-antigen/teichoic acid export membrane protein